MKGHRKQKKRSGRVSVKLAPKQRNSPMRLRNNRAMLSRVKIVKIY